MHPSSYDPRPIDTSEVRLPHELDRKVEELARNNHEVWAQERREQGWRYGPERNDGRKEHPGLVPYDELSEAEKDVDRATVEQTLKAAVALGCEIRVAHSAEVPGHRAEVNLGDDMEVWPQLPAGFKTPKEDLLRIYRHSDREAKSRLRDHRPTVLCAVGFGTLAVIAAIWELYDRATATVAPPPESIVTALPEFGFALAAIIAVGLGIRAALMPKWLMERHRAERCRFAKYRVLLRLAAADGDSEATRACLDDFKEQINTINVLDEDDVEQFIQEDPVPEDPPVAKDNPRGGNYVLELANHYIKQRLNKQAKYFLTQSRKKNAIDGPLRVLPPVFFFFSVFFAFLHFASVYGENRIIVAVRAHSSLLIFFAATLPVAGAGIRLWRSAFEYSRNTARFHAKYRALEQLISKLETDLGPQRATQPEEVVRNMWKGELILEQEHHEWLRLMKEAEWFG